MTNDIFSHAHYIFNWCVCAHEHTYVRVCVCIYVWLMDHTTHLH